MLRIQLTSDYGVAQRGLILTVTTRFAGKLIREGYAKKILN